MPYNNYSFVIDSSFKPFSFQEMLAPFLMYKDAYEKSEETYNDLKTKAGEFSYLAKVAEENPDSDAAKIYKGYADELNRQADDLANNGLNINNRRALTRLKQRYQGEIGQLYKADAALQKEKELRRAMAAKDPSMLWGIDDLKIDDYMFGKTPNTYGISGNELYTRGAQLGKSISSRIFDDKDDGSILGGLYRNWKATQGVKNADIGEFMAKPEVQKAIRNELDALGVTENLSGRNLDRATKSYLQGIYEGIIYQEKSNPIRDLNVPSWVEKRNDDRAQAADNRAARAQLVSEAMNGITWVNGKPKYSLDNDVSLQRGTALTKAKAEAAAAAKGASGGGRSGAAYDVRNKEAVIIGGNSGTIYKSKGAEGDGRELDEMRPRALSSQEYNNLIDNYGNINNEYIRNAIGNGNLSDYEIYIIPSGSTEISGTGWLDNDDLDEDVYIIKPRESKRAATENGTSGFYGESGTNDIPY